MDVGRSTEASQSPQKGGWISFLCPSGLFHNNAAGREMPITDQTHETAAARETLARVTEKQGHTTTPTGEEITERRVTETNQQEVQALYEGVVATKKQKKPKGVQLKKVTIHFDRENRIKLGVNRAATYNTTLIEKGGLNAGKKGKLKNRDVEVSLRDQGTKISGKLVSNSPEYKEAVRFVTEQMKVFLAQNPDGFEADKWDEYAAGDEKIQASLDVIKKAKDQYVLRREGLRKATLNVDPKNAQALEQAKLHDITLADVQVAQKVFKEAMDTIKASFDGEVDQEAWNIMRAREPALQKATLVLAQHMFDKKDDPRYFEQTALVAASDEVDASAAAPKPRTMLQEVGFGLQLFAQALWHHPDDFDERGLKPLDERQALQRKRDQGPQPKPMQIFPWEEAGAILGGSSKAGGVLVAGVEGANDFVADNIVAPAVEGAKQAGVGIQAKRRVVLKNKFIRDDILNVVDHTNRDSAFKQGVKNILRPVVAAPDSTKIRDKEGKGLEMLDNIARYGKSAAKGAFIGAIGGGLLAIKGSVTVMHGVIGGALIGALTGTALERYKEKVGTFVTGALVGAVVATTAIVIAAGFAALISTGAILFIGIGAVLFGIFGVVVVHSKPAQAAKLNLQQFVWSDDIELATKINHHLERVDTLREVLEEAASVAEGKQGVLNRELSRQLDAHNIEKSIPQRLKTDLDAITKKLNKLGIQGDERAEILKDYAFNSIAA